MNGTLIQSAEALLQVRSLVESDKGQLEGTFQRVQSLVESDLLQTNVYSGAAATAFGVTFETAKATMNSYLTLLDNYMQALTDSANKYSEAAAKAEALSKSVSQDESKWN